MRTLSAGPSRQASAIVPYASSSGSSSPGRPSRTEPGKPAGSSSVNEFAAAASWPGRRPATLVIDPHTEAVTATSPTLCSLASQNTAGIAESSLSPGISGLKHPRVAVTGTPGSDSSTCPSG